jgi:hypothetical protein
MNGDLLVELLLGLGLSAAAGLRVFVPLLVMSLAAVVGHLDLPTNFDWAETSQAAIVLAVASFLEIGGYYIPLVDHLLDTVSAPAAVIAGTLITAAVIPDGHPLWQWTLALIAGGGTAGLTKGATGLLRLISTATSAALANPLLATVELVLAVGLALLAITAPIAAGVVVLGLIGLGLRAAWEFMRRRFPPTAPKPS